MNTSTTAYRKYKFNVDFFKTWSSNMSYILGFACADGCINKGNLCIALQKNDVCVLEHIRDSIGSDLPIKYYTSYDKESNKYRQKCRIYMCSVDMVQDLNKLNICSRKTGKEKLPEDIPAIYLGDYLRGLFDGDGSVNITSKSQPIKSEIASASKEFLESIQNKINIGNVYKQRNIWRLCFNSMETFLFRDIIYHNDGFSLLRKKNKMFSLNREDLKRIPFSKEEERIIYESYKNHIPIKDIAKMLNRSYDCIKYKGRKLKVNREKYMVWTEQDFDFILQNFDIKNSKSSIKFIAEELGRTEVAVTRKISEFKLRQLHKESNIPCPE